MQITAPNFIPQREWSSQHHHPSPHLCNPITLLGGCTPATYNVLYVARRGTLTLDSVTVHHGKAHAGGGVDNYGMLTVKDSVLSGNFTETGAGAIVNQMNTTMTIFNSTLSGNKVEWYGAIWNFGVLAMTNSTLYGNAVTYTYGGGIYNVSRLKFINTILAHSTSGDCVNNGAIHVDSTHNLVMASLDEDPMLGPLSNNSGPTLTHAMLTSSPAIDAGSKGHCPNTEQRGFYRPFDWDISSVAVCDIGTFELHDFYTYLPLVLKQALVTIFDETGDSHRCAGQA